VKTSIRPKSSQSVLVNVPSATNLNHNDDAGIILNLVNDAVGTLANSVALLIREFLAPVQARVHSKRLDPLQDSPNVLLWDGAEVSCDGLLEQKPISCHALSSLRAAPHT